MRARCGGPEEGGLLARLLPSAAMVVDVEFGKAPSTYHPQTVSVLYGHISELPHESPLK